MLTEKEKQFLIRWETTRQMEGSFKHKCLAGLPMAFLFASPVLFFFIAVKIFFPAWFTTATHKSNSQIVVRDRSQDFAQLSAGNITMIVVAIMLLSFFFSYFRMNYKWENNEQLYQELKAKEKKTMHAAS